MGLLRRIDEALATVRESRRLAAIYAARARQAPEVRLIAPDRSVEHEQPPLAA